jgi:uncharacterized protein (TIGR01619 family)
MSQLPQGNWNFYIKRIKDKPASIFVDLSAGKFKAGLPELLVVVIPLVAPDPAHGMSSKSEFQTLVALEDALIRALEPISARPVGRITSNGRRLFFFYAPRTAEPDLSALKSQFPAYKFAVGWQNDPAWKGYSGMLCPNEEEMQSIQNHAVLEALKKGGDNLSLPRDITHWSYFSEPAARDAFVDQIAAAGYRVTRTDEVAPQNPGGSRRFAATYAKEGRVDPNSIDALTLELFHLAKRYGGQYDGWETQVMK